MLLFLLMFWMIVLEAPKTHDIIGLSLRNCDINFNGGQCSR